MRISFPDRGRPSPYPGSWPDAGELRAGDEFSLAWRCLDAQYCMLNDVKQTVTDGLLGLSDKNGSGLHIKIGASPIESANPISITNAMSLAKIREKLGYNPLADSVMDSIENGSIKILCIPVKASTDGVITAGTKVVATDSGDISLTGKPYNSFQIIIQIYRGQGVLNTASFKYSIDGGNKYSDEITVPLSGKYNINVAGIEIDFTLWSR